MELQGQEAELRQRRLPRRAPAGERRIPLQRRHLPAGFHLQTLQGSLIEGTAAQQPPCSPPCCALACAAEAYAARPRSAPSRQRRRRRCSRASCRSAVTPRSPSAPSPGSAPRRLDPADAEDARSSSSTSTARRTPRRSRSAPLREARRHHARRRRASAAPGRWSARAPAKRWWTMPGKAPFTITSPLSFFNAPPRGGRPTLIAHAYETVPAPQTLLVPIAIEQVLQRPLRLPRPGRDTRSRRWLRRPDPRRSDDRAAPQAPRQGGRVHRRPLLRRAPAGRRDAAVHQRRPLPPTLTSPCHFPR